MRYLIVFLLFMLLFSACKSASSTSSTNASPDAKRYKLKGKVISVDKAKKTAVIEHEEVVGYMQPMTMPFVIKADWVWEDLKPGVEIASSELVVDEANDPPYWLENLQLSMAIDPNTAPPVDERFAQIGKEVPEFFLTNQDGKRISTRDFQGKTWALTFIYARCPLPNACIRMSTNFSDAALEVMKSDLKDKVRLLSISFDPENDTPAKLRQYGLGYLGKDAKPDFSVWQLAVGNDKEVRAIADFFGLRYEVDQADKTQFTHSLRTAVIGPDGKVTRIFSGSEWSGNDLLGEIRKTAK